MQQPVNEATLLGIFYNAEVALSRLFAHFHYEYAPVFVDGDIADPNFYNIPYLHPVTTEFSRGTRRLVCNLSRPHQVISPTRRQ